MEKNQSEDFYLLLAGGVGAAKFIQGLASITQDWQLKIIVNTADDIELFGLKICPDLDIITYSLANLLDTDKGWGYEKETFHCMQVLKKYYSMDWFNLGDKDLATHIYRSHLFKKGYNKTEITKKICSKLGIKQVILPMCNEKVETYITSPTKKMHFEEFYIKHQCKPEVTGIDFKGINKAKLPKDFIDFIDRANKIIICPSNPIVSIGTILNVGNMREILSKYKEKVFAISPIVMNAPIKGPADKLMKFMGLKVSCVGVAEYYKDLIGTLIIDYLDKSKSDQIEKLGIRVFCFDTMMINYEKKKQLANFVINL